MFVNTIAHPFPGLPCRRKSNLKQSEPSSTWFKRSCCSQQVGRRGLAQEAKPGRPSAVDAAPPLGVPPARPSRPRWGLPAAQRPCDQLTLSTQ